MPRKNLFQVCGRPLIEYTIDAAQGSKMLTDVVVSTDDLEIAEVARLRGVEVPFMRPPELATDTSPTIDVIFDVCAKLANLGRQYDAVCLLQPTSPQRDGLLIDECLARFVASNADSLITIARVPHHFHPRWVYSRTEDGVVRLFTGGSKPPARRQELSPVFVRDGRVYVTKVDVVLREKSLYGQVVYGYETDLGINIDSVEDLVAFERTVAESRSGRRQG